APSVKGSLPKSDEEVTLSEISKSGGLVNAYEAAKLAETLVSKKPEPVNTKMKVKQTKKA
ncbi:MAG: hypothetical protein V4676_03065, partial [Bacteroidota bacterium]